MRCWKGARACPEPGRSVQEMHRRASNKMLASLSALQANRYMFNSALTWDFAVELCPSSDTS